MKQFKVTRKFERDVIKTEQFDMECEVPLHQITHQDMLTMAHPQLRSYTAELRQVLKRLIAERTTVTNDPEDFMEHFEVKNDNVTNKVILNPELKPVNNVGKAKPTRTHNRKVGINNGKTSKYHYVYFYKATQKWRASLHAKGHGYFCVEFEDEARAAFEVDVYLDSINDTKRPRNRDEFPEIQALQHKDIA